MYPPINPIQPTQIRLDMLYNLSRAFNSSLDLDEVLNRVIDEVIIATKAERGFVMMYDAKGELTFRVARGIDQSTIIDPVFQVSLGVAEGVARNGESVLTGDAQIDPRFSERKSVQLLGLRSILCVPLKVKDQILGTIYVDNRVQSGIFTPDDLDLLNAIASSAAIAIENARLYQVAVEKGRLEQELQMARQLQASLLPQVAPQVPGWEFGAQWLPARQVAGDYYDIIPGQGGQLGLIIADVSDKGLHAALFMALARSVLRASMDQCSSPMEGMNHANRLICADSTNGMFVTMFYALLDPEKNQITYVNAGHNPPLFCKTGASSDAGRLMQLERTGMAVGVLPDTSYQQGSVQFEPGDILVLYTDGVTEASNPQDNFFGMERLKKLVRENCQASAAEIALSIEQSVKEFSHARGAIEGHAAYDDITILVVKRR